MSSSSSADLLIRDVSAITLDDPVVREDVTIAVSNGRIDTIYDDDAPSSSEFETVIDGQNRLATPGLINAHTHLAMVLMRGYADDLPLMRWLEEEIWPLEAELTDEDVYWGSLHAIAELVRSGTTCTADMYFHMDQVARAVDESGIRGLLAYGMIAPDGGVKAEREIAVAREFMDAFHDTAHGRVRTAVAPHAPYTCDPSVWDAAVELATEHDTLVHTHLAETRSEVDAARENWGQTPVERMKDLGALDVPVLAAHCVHLDEGDFEILSEHDVQVVHNPTSNLKLASGFAPVQRQLDRGINVAIGTDGAASNNNLDLLEEIRLATYCQKAILEDATALPALEAFRLGTERGAHALKWDGIGSLAPGQEADIVLWDMDRPHWTPNYDPVSNLVYSAQASDVATVIVGGRVVMKDRTILTFDEAKASAHVRAYQESHRRR